MGRRCYSTHMTEQSLKSPLRVIEVSGDGRARGRAHGEELRPLVHEHLARYLDAIAADLGTDPRAYLQGFLRDTRFLPAIRRWTPDLLEELRGIAEGSGADFDLVYARSLSDEEPWYRREYRLRDVGGRGCSSVALAARGQQPVVVAQNMDTPRWWDGTQVVVRVRNPSGLEALVFTVAGKISLAGMNSAGLAMCCNTLSQLDYSRDGLPEDFVVRGFLAQPTWAEGLGLLASVPHASGQNYTIGAPGCGPLNVECSARGMATEQAGADRPTIVHTNHPLRNGDQGLYREHAARLTAEQVRERFGGTTHERLRALEHLAGHGAIETVDQAVAALSAHDGPVCRHGEVEGRRDQFTLGCLVMELVPGAPRLHVAPGPPCSTPFTTLGFG